METDTRNKRKRLLPLRSREMPPKKRSIDVVAKADVVLLLPFDDPFRPVRASRSLLTQWDCYSAKMIAKQAPDTMIHDVPAWHVQHMSRAMLVVFIKTLATSELLLPRDVSFDEILRTFEYEGIALPGNCVDPSVVSSVVDTKFPTLVTQRSFDSDDRIARHAKCIANALIWWPRLAHGLNEAKEGNEVDFTCTASRCWLRFPPRPIIKACSGDEILALVKQRARWLVSTLVGIGYLHHRLARHKSLDAKARDEQSFLTLLHRGIETSAMGHFLSVYVDMPTEFRNRSDLFDAQHRDVVRAAYKFADDVQKKVLGFGHVGGGTGNVPPDVTYARAVVQAAHALVRKAPDCARLFDSICADARTSRETPERKALERALKKHKIQVVEWHDSIPTGSNRAEIRPLQFPPAFLSKVSNQPSGPCVLLAFENVG